MAAGDSGRSPVTAAAAPGVGPLAAPRVVCIAPAWNEAGRIGAVVRAVPRPPVHAVVVVDDGSTDRTADAAREAGAVVIRHPRNRGVGAAIRTGFEYGLQHGFDIAVVVSGGGKTPPAQIPRLLAPLIEARADFAQGSRYLPGGDRIGMPLQRRWGTRAYSGLFSLLLGRRLTDASSGFRAVRLSLLSDARINLRQEWLDTYELEPYLLFKAIRLGHRVLEVPVTIAYPESGHGQPYTKMRAVVDWWRIFRPALFLAFGLKR